MPNMMESMEAAAQFANLAAAGTATLKTGPGTLVAIVVNKAVSSSTITVYDSTAGSGTKIGTITFPVTLLSSQMTLLYNVAFSNGLTVVKAAIDDITVVYR